MRFMYDVFFLSYDEPYAEQYWDVLKGQHPSARRCKGIAGIQAAHAKCAEKSRTPHFFVVDADNQVIRPEIFAYRVPEWDAGYVHLWYAKNSVNGLTYGWGGIKLFPKNLFNDATGRRLDMTTSFPLKIIEDVASITHFNTTPYETWRSAFRECVKLSQSDEPEAIERLETWCKPVSGYSPPYTEWATRGAQDGVEYGSRNRDDFDALMLINDYAWLKARFDLISGYVARPDTR